MPRFRERESYHTKTSEPSLFPSLTSDTGQAMNPETVEYFRDLLQSKLEALIGEARHTVSDLSEGEEPYADPTDRATAEADRNFVLRIRDRERRLIQKIQEALERIENGTYGYCDTCGEEIDERRLAARPVTTQCIDCKTEAELREKTGS